MIDLSQEDLKRQIHYDPQTGIFTRLVFKRGIQTRDIDHTGNVNAQGYIVIGINRKQFLAHRLAWLYVHGHFPKYIDHINRIKTDNRLINLRSVTHSQNHENVMTRKDNTSGHKGVHFYKPYQRWQVYINHEGKRYTLGYRDTFEEAVQAYQEAAADLHTCNPVAAR